MKCICEIFFAICITGMRVYGAEEGIDKIEIHMPLVETQRVRYYSLKKIRKRKKELLLSQKNKSNFTIWT